MEWGSKPEEYRYILGDFIRSGIHIKYNKHTINGKPSVIDMDGKNLTTYPNSKTILFPYITGRQYQVYKEYHIVSSENDSLGYCIFGEYEAGDIDYDVECFRNFNFFCEVFGINSNDKTIFQDESDWCYAFIFDYQVRFIDIFGAEVSKYKDIQKKHIFDIYKNYTQQHPFYPINMSLEWFYLLEGKRLGVDTILRSVDIESNLYQDDLITNYVIDSFSDMSEDEIITTFKAIRDRYAHKDKTRKDEWYTHTAALMDTILESEGIEHIAMKIRKLRAFCNNKGIVLSEIAENNVPHLKKVLSKYKKNIEKVYHALRDKDYIDERTTLSDFKYYLTGVLEENIQGKIYWKKDIIEMIDFLLCISDDKGEWTTASQIFVDREGKHPTPQTLKSTKSQYYPKHTDKFEELLR